MSKAEKFYKDNIKNAEENIKSLDKITAYIGWSRLAIVLVAIGMGYKLYKASNFLNFILIEVLIWLAFAFVAIIHGKKINERDRLNILLEINQKGLNRLNGKYKEESDKGEDLIEENHSFCEDLDVFGNNSLFQMINTTRTKSGRNKLKEILLLKKLPSKDEVVKKQEAIKELGEKVEWRQQLYIDGTFKKNKNEELEQLIEWGKTPSNIDSLKLIISGIFIAVTVAIIVASIFKIVPFSLLILDLMVNYVVIKILTKDIVQVINLFHSIKNSVRAYSNILNLIESEEFESSYLKELKLKLNSDGKVSCSKEMNKLANLLDWVGDSMANAYYFILNVFVFADVLILFNLDKWKEKNGASIENWLKVMGEFDALSSISNLSFDHEEWCFGNVDCKEVRGIEMAHPLIGDRAVSNTYELIPPKQITLITGSNMSGKSTFLRTIGINLLLTYIGAPACAKEFSCPIMNIYTCMRTKDNLEESISSFYAEILRIKLIIDACKKGQQVFVLLDEIFKGTNSRDRHVGATVLIKQLISNGAIGLVSTHDLELCDLEEDMKEVENYNFREYYEDDKIKFDYKLRKGKSNTQNAVYLMKLAGIDFKE